MPGPGGGGHGGGGGRGFGGGFGGGHGGGGFGGGWGHRPPPMHHGFGFWGPRFYGGGGCLGGLLGMLMLPIIIIMLVVVVLISTIGSAFTNVVQGGQILYDEEKMQDYADAQYAAEFGTSGAYEDHILLVFAVEDEEYYDYAYIAWVGDHINTKINNMFGNDQTALGRAIKANVNQTNYKYSLDSNLAGVVTTMQENIEALGLDSSYNSACKDTHADVTSHLTNRTESMELTEATVNDALAAFTEATGISMVIVVDEAEDVLGKTLSFADIMTVIVCIGLLIFAIVLIVKAVKKKNNGGGNGNNNNNYNGYNNNNNYNNGYGNNYNNGYNNNRYNRRY